MLKVMSVQRPQLQDKLYIVMQKWDQNDRNALFTLHSKITAATTTDFFSDGFSVNAENIQLGG